MEEQSDSTFVKNISIVIGILVIFAIFIAFVARDIGFQEEAKQPLQRCAHRGTDQAGGRGVYR